MCALSSTQALDEALVRSVQCSKQARKALARGDVPVAWLDVTAADDAVAERLAPLLAGPARCAHDDDAFEAHNARTKREFVELFAGDGLDPANNELAPATAVAVARGLNLNAADAFCDLGCSAGALTMAVAVATEARLAHGVELSPRGTERALLAKERCGDDRVEFFQGDLRDGVDHAAYDVFYCGIRGVASRPRVLGKRQREPARRTAALQLAVQRSCAAGAKRNSNARRAEQARSAAGWQRSRLNNSFERMNNLISFGILMKFS